jgi:hypothetical protein
MHQMDDSILVDTKSNFLPTSRMLQKNLINLNDSMDSFDRKKKRNSGDRSHKHSINFNIRMLTLSDP